jgi:hypothetical protein
MTPIKDDKGRSNTFMIKEQLQEKELKHYKDDSIFGLTLLTNPGYISSPRAIMFTLHLKQFVNLNEPAFPKVFTNYENMVGKYSTNYKEVKNDAIVIAKIPRFMDNPNHLYTLFTYDEKNDYYDIVDKKIVENLTEKFGFAYKTDFMDNLKPNDSLHKGDILYKSLSYDDEMNYCYGLNATILYLSHNSTIEDAAFCSESFAKRMTSKEVESVMVTLNDNDILCNLLGNRESYKAFPDIGEEIDDGVICAKRRIFNNQLLYDLKSSNLRNINFSSDTPYYSSGKIVDIMVYCNKPLEEIKQNAPNKQLLYYVINQNQYYKEVNVVCKRIIASGSNCSDMIKYLYKRSTEILDPNYKWKVDDGGSFSNMMVEFLIERDMPLKVGSKITGTSGDKSVISDIWPDENMPFTIVDGVKKPVEIVLNVLGIPNRENLWQLFQQTINFISNRIIEKLRKMNTVIEMEKLLFDYVSRFSKDQFAQCKSYYDNMPDDGKKDFFEDIFIHGIYIHIPPMWEDETDLFLFDKISKIYDDLPWIERYDVYVKFHNRIVKMMNKLTVGEKYIIKMKQTSKKGFSARATGTVSKQGLPSKSNKAKVNLDPWSKTPIRMGIDENINTCIGSPSELIAKLHLFYRNSPNGRKYLSKRMSTQTDMINDLPDNPEFTNRNVEILQCYLKCLGYRLEFEEKPLVDIDIKTDNGIEVTRLDNGTIHIGTEEELDIYNKKCQIIKEEMDPIYFGSREEYDKEVNARLEEYRELKRIIHGIKIKT